MDEEDRLVNEVYEAAANQESWQETSRRIAEFTRGGSVHLLLASLETGEEYLNLFVRGDPDFASEYLHDYAATDFRVPRVMGRKLGSFADERAYVSDDDTRDSAIHQDLLPRYGVHNINGANMSLDGCIGWFGISTVKRHDEFDPRKRLLLEKLSTHILNAMRIVKSQHELLLARELSFASIDLVNGGVIVYRGHTIVHVNAAMTRFLTDGFFALRNGQLACTNPAEQVKLAAFLRSAQGQACEGSLLLRHLEAGAAYLIRLHPLPPRSGSAQLGAEMHKVMSIVETNVPATPDLAEVVAFCTGYGVSNSEAMTLHAVINSTNLALYAESRGIGLPTVQQQLKSAMAKMDLNSQKKIFQAFERYRMFAAKPE